MFVSRYARSVEAAVSLVPRAHGAQAGVLLYEDDLNYVKLVVEGDKVGGTMIVLAAQIDGVPKVLAKLEDFPNDGTAIALSLSAGESGELTASANEIALAGVGKDEAIAIFLASGRRLRATVMAHSFEAEEKWASFESFTNGNH